MTDDGEHLAGRASRALGWSFANTALSRLGTLAIGIALARLLGPDQFGVYAVATVALIAVLSFNELGVSLAIVRWEGDPREIAPTVTTIAVCSSVLLAGAMTLSAAPFARLMGEPSATPVIQAMAVAIVVNGIVATPAALLQREFQQGRRMAIDQVNTWTGAILSLLLVLAGLGAMSLAIGRIAGSVVAAGLFVRWSPLPVRFGWSVDRARALLRFGLPLAGASLVVFLGGYADQLVVGGALGATALGFYLLAFNLAGWPGSIFSQPLRSVAPAAFARMQADPTQMNRVFATIIGLLSSVSLPVCALIAGAATPLVRFVYGSVWLPSAAVLAWLAAMAGFRIMFELSYDYLVVQGRSRAILISQIAWLVASVPTLIAGASLAGISGVAASQVAVAAVVMTPLYCVLLRASGVSLVACARRMAPGLAAAGVVGLSSWQLSRVIDSDFLACAASGLLCLFAVALLLFLDRASLRAVRRPAGPSAQPSTETVAT